MQPKEKKKIIIQIIVAVMVIMGIGVFFMFSPSSEKTEEMKQDNSQIVEDSTSQLPEQFAQSFIEWYMGEKDLEVIKNAKEVADEASKKGYITEEFRIGLPNKVTASFKEGIDVITCTKVKPTSLSVKIVLPVAKKVEKIDQTNTSYDIETSLPGHKISMTLTKEEDVWKVQSINCPAVPSGNE